LSGDRRLVLASRNPGKVAEFRRLLAGTGWSAVTPDAAGFEGDLLEPGETYEENALTKATLVLEATGVASLADDSGIEIPALGGWPGPRSARWMGDGADDADRLRGVLAEVERRSPEDRRARYVCVACLVRPGMAPIVSRAETWGILVAPRGTGGFGYDPGFLSDDLGITFGEAVAEAKDAVSHRGRAVRALVGRLAAEG
jgi:XTP/dITP diphosphohydrolase